MNEAVPVADAENGLSEFLHQRLSVDPGRLFAQQPWGTSGDTMPCFIQINDAAESLSITRSELEEFKDRGWITFCQYEEVTYLRGHQHYRAKFILQLRDRLALAPHQISKVLEYQTAPYSLSSAKLILAQRG